MLIEECDHGKLWDEYGIIAQLVVSLSTSILLKINLFI
jgi:hypothetical protein